MKFLGIRFCHVDPDAEQLSELLGQGLGLPAQDMEPAPDGGFPGAIFAAGDSWIDLWERRPRHARRNDAPDHRRRRRPAAVDQLW